jgi:hypothetical protein
LAYYVPEAKILGLRDPGEYQLCRHIFLGITLMREDSHHNSFDGASSMLKSIVMLTSYCLDPDHHLCCWPGPQHMGPLINDVFYSCTLLVGVMALS